MLFSLAILFFKNTLSELGKQKKKEQHKMKPEKQKQIIGS